MDPHETLGSQPLVGRSEYKRRTGLFTLLFTDVAGSAQLKAALGDQTGVALIQSHHMLVRKLLSHFSEAEEIGTAGDSFLLAFAKPSGTGVARFRLKTRVQSVAEKQSAARRNYCGARPRSCGILLVVVKLANAPL